MSKITALIKQFLCAGTVVSSTLAMETESTTFLNTVNPVKLTWHDSKRLIVDNVTNENIGTLPGVLPQQQEIEVLALNAVSIIDFPWKLLEAANVSSVSFHANFVQNWAYGGSDILQTSAIVETICYEIDANQWGTLKGGIENFYNHLPASLAKIPYFKITTLGEESHNENIKKTMIERVDPILHEKFPSMVDFSWDFLTNDGDGSDTDEMDE